MIETTVLQQTIDEINANTTVLHNITERVLNSERMMPVALGIRRAKREGDAQLMRVYTDMLANMIDSAGGDQARSLIGIRAAVSRL